MKEFFYVLGFAAKSVYSRGDVWLSPLCLATVVLLLFSFGLGYQEEGQKISLLMAQSFVVSLLSISWFLSKVFASLVRDHAFEHLRVMPVSAEKLYGSYLVLTLCFSFVAAIFTVFVASAFLEIRLSRHILTTMAIALSLYSLSTASLGVLCAGLTAKAKEHHILFPLIYFPLNIPPAITAHLYSHHAMTHNNVSGGWLWLLLVEGVVFTGLCGFLFREISD
ncbi:MAG: heme exporter protein CcmB [Proteobacteria bacterium]|nr:heme exporter protein CcmB [Pseudomonadota bacterium]